MFYIYFSLKTISQYIKDDTKSPLFSKSGKLSGLSQCIYDLLLCGIRGVLKKDSVISALRDMVVSILYSLLFIYSPCKSYMSVFMDLGITCWLPIYSARCCMCTGCRNINRSPRWWKNTILLYNSRTGVFYIG